MNLLLAVFLGLQIVVCVALVAVILMQRSEGGALGMGGGPSGFMTARGAGNLLTGITAWLAGAFFVLSIGLTIGGNYARNHSSVIQQGKVQAIDPAEQARALKAQQDAAAAAGGGKSAQPGAAPDLGDLVAPPPQAAPASAPAAPAKK